MEKEVVGICVSPPSELKMLQNYVSCLDLNISESAFLSNAPRFSKKYFLFGGSHALPAYSAGKSNR
jgi:hypothetical protein